MSAHDIAERALGTLLDDAPTAERISALAAGTEARILRGQRARAMRKGALVTLGVVAAVALAAFLLAPQNEGAPQAGRASAIALENGGAPAPIEAEAGAAAVLAFDDGSRVELRRGRLEPLSNEAGLFELGLVGDEAEAIFEIAPGGPRRWVVHAGALRVEVLGTRFGVGRRGGAHEVWVERGVVRVGGAFLGEPRVLRATERLWLDERRDEAPRAGDALAAAPAAAAPAPPHAEAAVPAPARARQWSALARSGDHDAAYAELGAEGVHRETRSASPEELMLLADVARLSGHAFDAVQPLERLLAEHPSDARAPLAAVVLGRLEMDVLGRPHRARTALERGLALGVPSALENDVQSRLARLGAAAPARASDERGAGLERPSAE